MDSKRSLKSSYVRRNLRMTPADNALNGQVALVTGAGRGIGAAIALRLGELGASLWLAGRTRSSLADTASKIALFGSTPRVQTCDVSDADSVDALARRVDSETERLNILVNNAGVGDFSGPLHQMLPETWGKLIGTNLTGVYHMIRAFAPIMIRTGGSHIINISSLAGKNALPNGAAYAASKWGLNGLTVSVAEELRGHNIRVSMICPGSVHTDFSPHAGKDASRMLQGADVAHAVAMLVTQSAQSFASEILLRPTMKP
jgi:3-oxoacyl-[acyl-carrier protein] reductase